MSSSDDSESSEHEISAPRYEIPRSLQQNLSEITRLQASGLRPSHDPRQIQRKSFNSAQTQGGQQTQEQTTQHCRSTSHIAVYKPTNTQNVIHWLQTNHWSPQEQFCCQSACQISNRNETNTKKYSNPDRTLNKAFQLKNYRSLGQRETSYQPQQPVEFSVKGLSPVMLDNGFVKHGCLYTDLLFPKPSKVAEVRFRNHYTASITVFVRHGVKSPWIRSIARKVLMPRPAYVDNGEEQVSMTADESETDWSSLVGMRLVLRQPSARWRKFHVEELNVFSVLQPPAWTMYTHPDGQTENAVLTLLQLQTEEALASSTYVFESLPGNDESSDEDTE